MAGLRIFTSNRLEILVEQLAETVRQPLAADLRPEVVIVQSRGMARWISFQIARHNGICANMDYPFPNTFLDSVFKQILPEMPKDDTFNPPVLTFRIMKVLPDLLDRPEFNAIKRYLADDERQLKRYQLADKISDLFDQYLVFRPDLIFGWEAGKNREQGDARWQALLWRALANGKETAHRARLRERLLGRTAKAQPDDAFNLPPRVSLFGISYLPPYHLQAFAALSKSVQVNLFTLNPCREYWADILSDIKVRHWTKKYAISEDRSADYYLEKGNTLLSSLGRLGQDFFALVNEFDGDTVEQFDEIAGLNLLTCIQADILNLNDRRKEKSHTADEPPDGSDGSIQIHSCHSPVREIEVLHDQLLAMFEENSDLTPEDIVVMAPDIDTYAPYVDAVFASRSDGGQAIPFNIADRTALAESRLIKGFMSLLELKDSRLAASQVLALLRLPGVLDRLDILPDDLGRIDTWIRELNIRWGWDASEKSRIGLPAFANNTWQIGLDRIMLGFAMPGYGRHMFAGILPYDHIEGNEAELLGKFVGFLRRIVRWCEDLGQPRSLSEWQVTLTGMLDTFFYEDKITEPEIRQIRNALEDLGQRARQAEYENEVDLDVVRNILGDTFRCRHHGPGFISGGVTFCAMLPMRSIPFKVICLVGMNDDAFPRNHLPLGFDLIQRHPRSCDRSMRKDDRYLFLEAVISARQILYISYVGQSLEDNAIIPPASPVNELLDYITSGFGVADADFIVRHPLQAFSRQYFDGESSRLFSYSTDNLKAVQSADYRSSDPVFFNTQLPDPPLDCKSLQTGQFIRFFKHPTGFLLKYRLGINLDEGSAVVEDKENFTLDGLDRYRIGQELVKQRIEETVPDAAFTLLEATGLLPQGEVGKVWYNRVEGDAAIFYEKLNTLIPDRAPVDKEIDLHIAGYHIRGRIGDLYPSGRIQFRFAKRKPGDLLSAWLNHLLLLLEPPEDFTPVTTLVNHDIVTRFETVKNAETILTTLLDIYWDGLCRPLQFFPETAFEYSRVFIERGLNEKKAFDAARRKWIGNDFQRGEIQDPYNRRCFEHTDPLDQRFQQLAEKICFPIFDHMFKINI
jgi:exodeoxyribonuclease V gamma subunit